MAVERNTSIEVSRRFDAPPELVFDAWSEPALAREWLFVTDDGEITRCELDARVGGKWTVVRRGPSPEPPYEVIDMEHTGEYLDLARPSRLAFTFGVPQFSPDVTRVTVKIEPDGDGCVLTLTNEHVPEEWAARSEQGWRIMLDQLANALRN